MSKQGVVIQGPTNFYKEVCETWEGWPNVVWSTWDDEPQENIDYIRSKNIDVLLNKKPEFAGYLNINYQLLSTFNGLQFLQARGIKEALKTRGDHTISSVKDFLESLSGRRICFLALSNVDVRKDITYELEYIHEGHDYPSDNLIYGKIDDMLMMFNFQTDKIYNIPPEAMIVYNYMVSMGIKFDLDFNYLLRNGVSFVLRDCINKGIKIHWLKHNKELIQSYDNEEFKF